MATRLESLVEAVAGVMNDASVLHLVGRKHLAHHQGPRRIVWVRRASPLEAPRQAGAVRVGNAMVRACLVRVETVTAFVSSAASDSAASDEETELLFENLVAAVSLELGPSAVMSGYEWVSQGEQVAGETLRTDCIALSVTIRMPVADEVRPLRAITSVQTACGTMDANNVVTPEP